MSFWSWFTGVFAKSFFDFIKDLIDSAFNNQARENLGAARQENANLKATAKAKSLANSEGMAPGDIDQTIGSLEDGTF